MNILKNINELEEKEAGTEARTMEQIYDLSFSEPKNTIGAAQCMERKVLEIINKSDFKLKKLLHIKQKE